MFLADVRRCGCGGALRVVAVITSPDATQAIAAAPLLAAPRDIRAG